MPYINAVESALSKWDNATGMSLFVLTHDLRHAGIIINLVSSNWEISYESGTWGNMIFYENGTIKGHELNVSKSFVVLGTNGATPYELEGIAMHELGHALGLGHSLDVKFIMVQSYTSNIEDWLRPHPTLQPSPLEVETIRWIYTGSTLNL